MAFANTADQNYQDNINKLSQQSGIINPSTIQNALSNGGVLSSSLGFNVAPDVMGLSPDEVNQMIANRSQIINQNLGAVKGAVDLYDTVTGASNARKMQEQAAQSQYQQQSENERQQRSLEQQQAQMNQNDEHFQKTYEQNDKHFQATQDLHDKQFNLQMSKLDQEMNLKERQLGIEGQRLSLDQRKLAFQEEFGIYKGAEIAAQQKIQSMEAQASSKNVPDSERPNLEFKAKVYKTLYNPSPGTVISIPNDWFGKSRSQEFVGLDSKAKNLIQGPDGNLYRLDGYDPQGRPITSRNPVMKNPYENLQRLRTKFAGFDSVGS